jgi:hypothetical protein
LGKPPVAALKLELAVLCVVLLTLLELLLLVALLQLEKLPLLVRLGPLRGDSRPVWSASSRGHPLRERRCCCIAEPIVPTHARPIQVGDLLRDSQSTHCFLERAYTTFCSYSERIATRKFQKAH